MSIMIDLYKKKPVVIEAVEWTGENRATIESFVVDSDRPFEFTRATKEAEPDEWELSIVTLEGKLKANIGDYIIKGVQGEFYACKPDIFKATYEAVV